MSTEEELTKQEIHDWIEELLKHFEMDHGYPSTYVVTPKGPEHGVVGDELGMILENGLELLGTLREELDIYEYEIEFDMDTDEDE